MRKITYIPQTKNVFSAAPIAAETKRKVAGYARVSTDSDEQFTSYEAQVDYYTNYIKDNPRWEFVGIYTDEGITGMNTRHRDGFKQMIADAMEGKIDLIVTKSVSRFARNTVDSLSTIRMLKDKGVEVFFEKESIWTFDSKGELLLTIMSSLAQEEARSISENVTWGVRKRFADGQVSLGYGSFLGYDKGADGKMVINPEEAKTVVLIFRMYIEGKSPLAIAKRLTDKGILTPRGKTQWSPSTIASILRNEKYKGDALLQKSFTVDFLNKKIKSNTGEIPQYYIEGDHEAIISPEEFDLVQAEINRRSKHGRGYSCQTIFSSKIICADCGCYYGQKVWHSNDKYRKLIWRCNGKFKGEKKCATPIIEEAELKALFMVAYSKLTSRRAAIEADIEIMLGILTDVSEINAQMSEQEKMLEEISIVFRAAIQSNASTANMQEAFDARQRELHMRYQVAEDRLKQLKTIKTERLNRRNRLITFLNALQYEKPVNVWEDRLWVMMLDHATVNTDESIDFTFYNGETINAKQQEAL